MFYKDKDGHFYKKWILDLKTKQDTKPLILFLRLGSNLEPFNERMLLGEEDELGLELCSEKEQESLRILYE